MSNNTARNRAEDLLQSLQTRARDWMEAEEGLVQTVRDMVENGISAQEIRTRLEDLVGRIKANKVWERLRDNDRVVALSDYRDDLEKRVEEVVGRFVESLPVATKNDLAAVSKQVKALNKKVNDLGRKLKGTDVEA